MLEQVIEAVREGGQLMRAIERPEVFVKDGHANFVTDGDLAVQKLLFGALAPVVPGAVFFAEEQDNATLTDAPTWVIDPIDGTFNYLRGRDCSSISVALLIGKKPVLGVIYNPYRDELFAAERGKGAFRNGARIRVSEVPFERAMIGFGTSPYYPELAVRSLEAAKRFLLEAGDLRRTGSAALDLCDVACGRSDVFYELTLSPWDFAAGSLIVEEAGGVFDMPEKPAVDFSAPAAILAASRVCFDRAKTLLLEA